MSLLTFKWLAAGIVFIAALIPGLLPLRITSTHQRFFTLADAFASGVFLGVGAFHLLPESIELFVEHTAYSFWPALLLCGFGIAILFGLEYLLKRFSKHAQQDYLLVSAYLLLIVLLAHSFIEGAALGFNLQLTDAILIFIAIIAHKSCASFALAISLRKTSLKSSQMNWMIIIFSLASPLGIIFATFITNLTSNQSNELLEAVFNAFAAGTFLYIGTLHTLRTEFREKGILRRAELYYFLTAILVMGIIARWV